MLCAIRSTSQNFDKSILNKNVKFQVWRNSTSITDTSNKNPGFLFLKVDLPEFVKDTLKKLPNEYILKLLNDPATDWATNLFLYDYYEKEAYLFLTAISSRKDWLPIKQSEIKYWRKKMKF